MDTTHQYKLQLKKATSKQPLNCISATFLKTAKSFFTLLLLFTYSVTSAQTQLELNATSVNTTIQGPVTSSQTATFLKNANGSATFNTATPTTTVTYSITSQVYSTGTYPGLLFGATSSGQTVVADNIWKKMNAYGGATSVRFTSNPFTGATQGIDVTTNYCIEGMISPWYMTQKYGATNLNAREYYGDIKIQFNRPVQNPVLHFAGIGGEYSSANGIFQHGFYTEFELGTADVNAGYTFTKLSGNTYFDVSGNTKIVNTNTTIPSSNTPGYFASETTHGSDGSVRFNTNGVSVTSIILRVYLKGMPGVNPNDSQANWGPKNGTVDGYVGDVFTMSVSIPTYNISGTVYSDGDGLNDNLVDGTGIGTAAGSQLYVNLLDPSGNLYASTAVNNSTGAYSFSDVISAEGYKLVLSTTNGSTTAALPVTWVNTGEQQGAGSGSDGTPNGNLVVTNFISAITNANFGIAAGPTAGSGTQNAGTNPGGTTQVTVNANAFINTTASSAVSPAVVAGIRVKSFPTNTTSIIINGTSYTSGTFPPAGVIVSTNSSGSPTQTITIDPSFNGSGNVVISFVARDGGTIESANTGTATIFFTTAVSGNVYNDVNGLSDNTVNGIGTNAGGLNAVLVNTTTSLVTATTAVNSAGVFSFTGLADGNYTVRITTNTTTVGSAPPAVALPLGWVHTGENIGSGAGSDGTVDGQLILNLVQASLSNVNFGIANCFASSTSSPTAAATAASGVYCAQSMPAPIQLNSSVTGGAAPYTYAWAGNGLSNTTIQHPTATPTANSSYTVTVTDAMGCKGTASTNIVYDNTVPSISWNCGTNPAWLRLTENHGLSWYWTTTSGGRFYTSSAYSMADDQPTSNLKMPFINTAGQYNVQITTTNGCTATGSIAISNTLSSCSIVLPDERIDLKAAWNNENVLLTWNTGINNVKNYTIERSVNGSIFIDIAKIDATESNGYSYNDATSPSTCTTLWFRIKATDNDGKDIYSKTVSLDCRQLAEGTLLVTPNPVTTELFKANYKIPIAGKLTLKIYDVNGKVIYTEHIDNVKANEISSRAISLPTNIRKGVYFIKLYKDQWMSKPAKIIVMK